MTRKRYVKLLMGHGYSRDTAKLYAERAIVMGRSYQQDYDARKRIAGNFYNSAEWAAIRTRYLGRWKIEKEPEA